MSDPGPGGSARTGRGWRWAFAAALAVQIVVLYLPRAAAPGTGLPLDKIVHVAIFVAVAWTGVRAGIRPWPLVAALCAQAVLSEIVQHVLLPARSGDPADVAADLVGIALGMAAGLRLPGRGSGVARRTRGKVGAR